MENIINSTLVQGATLEDIERLVKRVITEQLARLLQDLKPQLSMAVVPKTPHRYIKKNDVAKMLGVSLTSIDEWVRAGILRPCKINSRVYFTDLEIDRAMGNIDERRQRL